MSCGKRKIEDMKQYKRWEKQWKIIQGEK